MNFWRWIKLTCWLAGAFAALAQLPQARLNWIFPPGLRAGTTNELTVAGSDLDDPTGLLFSDARITATNRPGNAAVFSVIVPPEIPPGTVDVRFAGRFGVSNPRALAIGPAPEITITPTNTLPASAMELLSDTVANGRAQPSAALWFRFAATARQRFIVRVQADELDSRLVPDLAVQDAAGRELAVARRREWLDFTAPAAGTFRLQLHDQTFRGGEDFAFRLTLATGPHLDFALPNVLRAGETNLVTLFGRNLTGAQPSPLAGIDGQPLEQLRLEIAAPIVGETPVELFRRPASAALAGDAFAWQLTASNGISNPLLFTLTTNAVFIEEFQRSAGGSPATATNPPAGRLGYVTPPCELSGLFPKRGELSGVTFTAKKGDVFWLEVWSERLGFATDPFALLQRVTKNDQGIEQFNDVQEFNDGDTNLGGREFDTTTRDPAGRVEIKEDGSYRVLVRDVFNSGPTGPRLPYRLSLRRETPDFRLVVLPQPPPKTKDDDRQVHPVSMFIRRGETVPVKVVAFRRDGFNGAIELTATNLPAGVSAAPARLAAGQSVGHLLLTATEAATGSGVVQFAGHARVGTNEISHPAATSGVRWLVADADQETVGARLTRGATVAASAVEFAPVTLAPADAGTLAATVDGKLMVPVKIIRRGDFNAAFNLKPAGHPALDKAKDIAIAEKATNATVEINLAEAKLPEGTHTLWLQGTVAGKYRNNPEALTAAETELKEIGKALAAATAADKPKLEEQKKACETRRKFAEERAKPRDVTVMVYSQPFSVKISPAPKPEAKK